MRLPLGSYNPNQEEIRNTSPLDFRQKYRAYIGNSIEFSIFRLERDKTMENTERNEEVVSVNKFKQELRKRKVKQFFKDLPEKTCRFIDDHREIIVATAPVALWSLKKIIKVSGEMHDSYQRDREIYDYSLHRWCTLKRPLRPHEELEFKRRRAAGESVYDILNTMRILKY